VGDEVLSGIVLAAGKSKRMDGYIKALLPVHGESFLERIVRSMSSVHVDEILVVLGCRHGEIERAVNLKDAQFVINSEWRKGQLSSLRAGVQRLSSGSRGIIFTPVDHPLVEISTYERLIDTWRREEGRIVIPTYRGRKGHPALFPERVFNKILHEELPGGARDIIYQEKERTVFLSVDDPGVVFDIDTPDDYKRLIGELP
jgi:CTP:molybdopterin cytidylyltransferase MocA